ncbi:MAG TPA: S8 family serine peptidase, partial [Caldilineaceae bacterium]|nr:S8 family serine peptidase [Caldilineaceae bacterium]
IPMNEPFILNLTHPLFDAITVTIEPETHTPGRVARRRVATALRQVLQQPVKGWHVRQVPHSPRLAYDLTPPDEITLTVQEAWNLTYALRELPDVAEADPSFIVIQDAIPELEPDTAPIAKAAAARAARSFESCLDDAAPESADPNELEWSPHLVDAPCAWQVEPDEGGKRKGEGIRVGHPDSGYLLHPELFDDPSGLSRRILTNLERDFVDLDPEARDKNGYHGLSTSCIIVSSELTGSITGVAPAAELVSLRVTKPHPFGIPAPILFGSGARNLRDAIRYAVYEADCHVISISLGWFAYGPLHDAVIEAERNNVIVCAAAGNYTGIVIWPAAYPEAVAVAGCNASRGPWGGSAQGVQVAVSAPAENVWVPTFRHDGSPTQHQSNGTSFAVATVAGVAALWLAYHNREKLLERYRDEFTLTDVFRYVLGQSSDPFAGFVGNGFGSGIVNARRVLKTPLPTITELQRALPPRPKARAAAVAPSPLATIAAAFPDVPEATLRERLATLMNVDESELEARLADVEDEVLFHLVTDPALRAQITGQLPVPVARAKAATEPTPIPAVRGALATDPLSDRLRQRMGTVAE